MKCVMFLERGSDLYESVWEQEVLFTKILRLPSPVNVSNVNIVFIMSHKCQSIKIKPKYPTEVHKSQVELLNGQRSTRDNALLFIALGTADFIHNQVWVVISSGTLWLSETETCKHKIPRRCIVLVVMMLYRYIDYQKIEKDSVIYEKITPYYLYSIPRSVLRDLCDIQD